MTESIALAIGVFLGYLLKTYHIREQERELSEGMKEVARLTARLNKSIAETEQVKEETRQVWQGKARLN